MSFDTIVIGAGCAGLSCATALSDEGQHVLVLEKRNILGGRACSYPDPQTGEIVDNGQHLLLGCYTETRELLHRLGQTQALPFQDGFHTPMVGPDRVIHNLKTWNVPAPFHLLFGFLKYSAIPFKDRLKIFKVALALRKNKNLGTMSCTEWLSSMGFSKESREKFWDLIILATLNIHPDEAPANLLAVVLQRGFLDSRESSRVGLANVGLSDMYANPAKVYIEAHRGEVRTREGVEEVLISQDQVVGVRLHSGEVVAGSRVVVTVPPSALQKIKFNHEGIQALVNKTADMKPSPILSLHVWGQFPKVDFPYMGFWGTHFHWAFQKSSVYGQDDTKHWTLVASSAIHLEEHDKQKLIQVAEDELKTIPGFASVKITRAKLVRELEATWIPPLSSSQSRLKTRTPVKGLYFAGDWTDTGLPCTIESAVMSGHHAAAAIIEEIKFIKSK
ncbi:MAG: FAD-dependent oxidoreductase [Proteobacteria bacterium]|jgi:squalene-associated FAD-dependent desaturase|nr:FAD-dependent oxidoreductase [Pseudomonadota bacterium]